MSADAGESSGDIFATTRWTVVLAAAGKEPGIQALEELCGAYWYPLYAYVRRRGHSREDAEDLTQAFFAQFLRLKSLDGMTAGRGRFRAFLLASLQHFLANEWDRAGRLKRGGHAPHLPLDWATADSRFQVAGAGGGGPEEAFDREWALALLGLVLEKLAALYNPRGSPVAFPSPERLPLGRSRVPFLRRSGRLPRPE